MKLIPIVTAMVCLFRRANAQLVELRPCIGEEEFMRQTNEGTPFEGDGQSCGMSGSCGSGGNGCCRFHPEILRCDEANEFQHQPVRIPLSIRSVSAYLTVLSDKLFLFLFL